MRRNPSAGGRWRSSIKVDGRTVLVGHYDDEEVAAADYDTKALEVFGGEARPNFHATTGEELRGERKFASLDAPVTRSERKSG